MTEARLNDFLASVHDHKRLPRTLHLHPSDLQDLITEASGDRPHSFSEFFDYDPPVWLFANEGYEPHRDPSLQPGTIAYGKGIS